MTAPGGAAPRWAVPAVAVVLGAAWVAARTDGTMLPGEPAGSDWPQYLAGAHTLLARGTDPDLAASWPDWRHALYPLALGWLAKAMPAVVAARTLAGVGLLLAGVGAALLARALGGVAAAVGAVVLLASVEAMPWAAGWMNPYPLLAGVGTLALGCGAWSARAGDARWAAAAGLLGGLAWGIDPRGAVFAVGAAGAVLVGAGRARHAWVPGVALVGALALGPVLDRVASPRTVVGQQVAALARVPLDRQAHEQRARTLEEVRSRGPQSLAAACSEPGGAACAASLLVHNVERRSADGDLPVLALLAVVALLPRGRTLHGVRPRVLSGGRSVLVSALVLGVPTLAAAYGASRVLFPDRYLLPFLPALCVGVAVGAGRLVEGGARAWGARRALALAPVAAAALVAASAVLAPAPTRPREGLSHVGARVWAWAGATLKPRSVLMDCAGLGLEARALPGRLHAGRLNPSGIDGHACLAWARKPWDAPQDAWILTSDAGPIPAPGEGWASVEVFTSDREPAEPPVTAWRRLASDTQAAPAPRVLR